MTEAPRSDAGPEPRFVGIQPRFPGFLGRWQWLNKPAPAERLAALRIAAAVALLLDIGLGCLPYFADLFTADGLAGRDAYPWRFRTGHYYWSLLRYLPDAWGPWALLAGWVAAAVALLVGYRPLVSGLVCWACAVSFWNINPWVTNGGDQLRNTLLLGVAVSRSGAVWGVQSVRRSRAAQPAHRLRTLPREAVYVPGWPVKVLLVHLVCLYFFSGMYKLLSPAWRSGEVMYFVNHDLSWALVPDLSRALPVALHRLSAWVTLAWELGFPLLIAFRVTRAPALCLGVLFHVVTFLTLEIGAFALYSLAWYTLFVPWERWSGSRRGLGCRPEERSGRPTA
jgi:hypothetical protein